MSAAPAPTAPAGGFVKHPSEPASQAQVAYLKALLAKKEVGAWHQRYDLVTKIGSLTKGVASDLISGLKAAADKPVVVTGPTLADIELGYYLDEAGVLWSWQEQKVSKYSDKMVPKLAKLQITMKAKSVFNEETGAWEWIKQPKGKWVVYSQYASQQLVVGKLGGLEKLSPEQLAAQSKLFGVCVRCGRTLTAKASVAKSVGPVCAKYLGL